MSGTHGLGKAGDTPERVTLAASTGADEGSSTPNIDYEQLRAQLTRAVRLVCPAWLRDRSDDLVQTAMLKLRGLTAERHRELSFAYLRRMAYTLVVDEIRQLRRRREISMDDDDVPISVEANRPDPERRAMGREIGAGILDCLSRLKRDRRLAVTLYLQGHRGPEVAALLGWPPKRVENCTYRGLAALRTCLTAKGLSPGDRTDRGEGLEGSGSSLASMNTSHRGRT